MKKILRIIVCALCFTLFLGCTKEETSVAVSTNTNIHDIDYDSLEEYTDEFQGYMFIAKYNDHYFFVYQMIYEDEQPTIYNASEFHSIISEYSEGAVIDDSQSPDSELLDVRRLDSEYVGKLYSPTQINVTYLKDITDEDANDLIYKLKDLEFKIAFENEKGEFQYKLDTNFKVLKIQNIVDKESLSLPEYSDISSMEIEQYDKDTNGCYSSTTINVEDHEPQFYASLKDSEYVGLSEYKYIVDISLEYYSKTKYELSSKDYYVVTLETKDGNSYRYVIHYTSGKWYIENGYSYSLSEDVINDILENYTFEK